jgi:hypothetical protein
MILMERNYTAMLVIVGSKQHINEVCFNGVLGTVIGLRFHYI